jgi:hypothetical protein
METQYIVQGFVTGKRGRVEALPPASYKSEDEARRRAAKLGETCLGVIAFAQSADAEAGEYADPIILEKIGEVPDLG